MAGQQTGDLGAWMYLQLINAASSTLSKSFDFKVALKYISEARVEFKNQFPDANLIVSNEGLVALENPEASTRSFLARILFGLISAYEISFGVDEVWGSLWEKFKQIYEQYIIQIKEANLEFPLLKHKVDYLISGNLFGFSVSDHRKKDWIKGYPLVTTRNLIFIPQKEKGEENEKARQVVIPLQNILTLGREIYMGYEKRSFYGQAWVIDFKDQVNNSSCAVISGPKEFIDDYNKVVSFARRELRTLTFKERKVLSMIGQHFTNEQIEGETGMNENQLKNSVYRLKQLGCINEKNEITAYGLTIMAESPKV
ncbi:MAG: hypothetical protein ABH950_02475 [Candidatus Altiarchaeota archaeon]